MYMFCSFLQEIFKILFLLRIKELVLFMFRPNGTAGNQG